MRRFWGYLCLGVAGGLFLAFFPMKGWAFVTQSFNSGMQLVNQSDVVRRAIVREVNAVPVKTAVVTTNISALSVWQQRLGYKVVSGNVASRTFAADSRETDNKIRSAGFKEVGNSGGQSYSAHGSMALPQLFVLKNGYSELTNTTQNRIIWDTPTDNGLIAYQQVLKQVTQNAWVVDVDQIGSTQNSTIVTGSGGRYTVRKITTAGRFLDNDGETSLGQQGNPDLVKTFIVDTQPPQFVGTPNVKWVSNARGAVQRFNFAIDEGGEFKLEIREGDRPWYIFAQQVSSGSVSVDWDEAGSNGIKKDGDFRYQYTVTDKAGNQSETISGNIRIHSLPPVIECDSSLVDRTFSPNSDGIQDELQYLFSFTEPVTGSWAIYRADNRTKVGEGRLGNSVSSASITLANSSFSGLPDGAYYGVLRVADDQNMGAVSTFNFKVDRAPPVINAPSSIGVSLTLPAAPYRFSSTEPGLAKLTVATWRVTENIGSGSQLLTISPDTLADGRYVGQFEVTDFAGNNVTQSVNVLIDRMPPQLSVSRFSTRWSLREPIPVQIRTVDALSPTVAVGVFIGPWSVVSTSDSEISFDLATLGKSIPGLRAGYYIVAISATDSAGNVTWVTQNVTIAPNPVAIRCADVGPVSFRDTSSMEVTYSMAQAGIDTVARVSVSMLDSNGRLLRNVVASRDVEIGEHRFNLSGRDLPDGRYGFHFEVESEVGLVSTFDSKLEIDNTPPAIQPLDIQHNPFNYADPIIRIRGAVTDNSNKLGSAVLKYYRQPVGEAVPIQSSDFSIQFNGLVDGQRLPDGVHDFELWVSDLAGNVAQVPITLSTDTRPPVITGFAADRTLLRPDVPGMNQILFSVAANEPVTPSISISNSNGVVIRNLDQPPYLWNGSAMDQSVLNGTYQVVATVTDRAGNVATSSALTVVIQDAPSISGVGINPKKVGPVSPIDVSFIASISGSVSVNILDARDQVVRRLAVNLPVHAGNNVVRWDGRSDNGLMLRDGEYVVSIGFTDRNGIPAAYAVRKTVELDGTTPAVVDAGIAPALLTYPVTESAILKFRLSEPSRVTVSVLSSSGVALGIISETTGLAGMTELTWNGLVGGRRLPIGGYQLLVSAIDDAGNHGEIKIPVSVVEAMSISLETDASRVIFTPDGDAVNDVAHLGFLARGTGSLKLGVQILTANGLKVRSFADVIGVAIQSLDWNGRDDRGVLQPTGEYVADLILTDQVGQSVHRQVPIVLLQDKILLRTTANGRYFSFGGSGTNRRLTCQIDLAIPTVLMNLTGWSHLVQLKAEIYQNGRLVNQSLVSVTDRAQYAFSGVGLTDGPFELRLSGEGADRVSVEPQTLNFIADQTPPSLGLIRVGPTGLPVQALAVIEPGGPWILNTSQVSAIVNAEGVDHLDLYDQNQNWVQTVTGNAGRFSFEFPVSIEGHNRYFYQTVDLSGNRSDRAPIEYDVDLTSPEMPRLNLAKSLVNSTTYVDDVLSEAGTTVRAYVDGRFIREWVSSGRDSQPWNLTEGLHTLRLTAIDPAGNASRVFEHGIGVDLTPVSLTSENLSGAILSAGTYPVSVSFSETLGQGATSMVLRSSQKEIPIAGGQLVVNSGDDGVYRLVVRNVTDVAHNVVDLVSTGSIVIDTTRPVLTFSLPGTQNINRHTYSNSIQLSEPNLAVTLIVDGVPVETRTSQNGEVALNFELTEGPHSVGAIATDAAGNVSDVVSQIVNVDVTRPSVTQLILPTTQPVKVGNYRVRLGFSEPVRPTMNIVFKTATRQTQLPYFSDSQEVVVPVVAGDDGPSQIEISGVHDVAGNEINLISFPVFNIDTVAPIVTDKSLVHDLPLDGGYRDIQIRCSFSESVSAQYALQLPDRSELNLNSPENGIISVQLPKNQFGTATLKILNIHDVALNSIPDDLEFSFPVDSVSAVLENASFSPSTNRGSKSPLVVTLNYSEAIQSSPFHLRLRLPDSHTIEPDRIVFSDDRKQATGIFQVDAIEANLSAEVSGVIDDKGNRTADQLVPLGRVDNVAPIITGYGANVGSFSAIRTRDDANVVITMNIHEAYSKLYVRIYDRNGELKTTLFDHNGLAGDVVLASWNGTDSSGRYLPKGWYVMRAWGIDESGNESIPVEGLFEITEQHLDVTNFQTIPVEYSFKANGSRRFSYSIRDRLDAPNLADRPSGIRTMTVTPVASITEKIISADTGELVTVLVEDQVSGVFENSSVSMWDGKVGGQFVASGRYEFVAEVKNLKGILEGTARIPFVVDHDLPSISGVQISALPLSQIDGSNHTVTVNFSIDDNIATDGFDVQLALHDAGVTTDVRSRLAGQNQVSLSIKDSPNRVADGLHDISLLVFDRAKNKTVVPLTVMIDSTPPIFDFSIPSRNGFVTESVTIVPGPIVDLSPFNIGYQIDSQGYGPASDFDVSSIRDGQVILSMRARDAAGNTSVVTHNVGVDNDIAAPTFTFIPGAFTNTAAIKIEPNSRETHPYRYWVQSEGREWTPLPAQSQLDWTLRDTEMMHTVHLKIEDQAGNVSAETYATVVLDKTAPVIRSVRPAGYSNYENGIYYYTSQSFNGSSWAIDSSAEAYGLSSEFRVESGSLTEGLNQVFVRLRDSANNLSEWSGPYSIYIDTVSPALSVIRQSGQDLYLTYKEANLRHGSITVLDRSGSAVRAFQTFNPSVISGSEIAAGVPDGQYTLQIQLTDYAYRTSNIIPFPYTVDTTPPAFSRVSSSTYINGSVLVLDYTVTDTTSGVNRVEYRIDSGAWIRVPGTKQIDIWGLGETSFDLWIRAVDQMGNISNPVKINRVTIDRTPPVLSGVGVNRSVINIQKTPLILSYSATDSGSGISQVNYWRSGVSSRTLPSSPVSFSEFDIPADDGPVSLSLQAVDRAGNSSSVQTVSTYFDRLPPIISGGGITPQYTNGVAMFLGAESDPSPGSGIAWAGYQLDDGSWITMNPATSGSRIYGNGINTASMAERSYGLRIRVRDYADNETTVDGLSFTVDRTPPVINMDGGYPVTRVQAATRSGGTGATLMRFSVTDSNLDSNTPPHLRIFDETSDVVSGNMRAENGSWRVKWNGWADISSSTGPISKQVQEGPYFVEVLAKDLAGNVASTASVVVLSDDILVGGNNAHYPSIERDSAGSIALKWGEGNRVTTANMCRVAATAVWTNGADNRSTVNFCLDVDQAIQYRYETGNQIGTNYSYLFGYGLDSTLSLTSRVDLIKGDGDQFRPIPFHDYFENSGYFSAYAYMNTGDTHGAEVRHYWTYQKFDGPYRKSNLSGDTFSQPETIISWPDRYEVWTNPLFPTMTVTVNVEVKEPVVPLINATKFPQANIQFAGTRKLVDPVTSFVVSDRRQGTIGSLWKNPSTGAYQFAAASPSSGYSQKIQDVIYNGPTGIATNLSATTNNGVRYLAWEDTRSGGSQIFYQAITAPRGPGETSFAPQSLKNQTQANPILLQSPKTTTNDIPVLSTPRPEFIWQVPTASLSRNTQFKIELFKSLIPTAHSGLPTFNFVANDWSDQYQEIAVLAGTYKITGDQISFTPDDYNALGKTDPTEAYRWQVKADWTGDQIFDQYSSTSELFQLDPSLEIEAPINYPNPFSDTTMIRYKLTREAKSVSIRIFDIAGHLVRVISNAPTAGTRPYHEYNQIQWDGRNGPEDSVNNGVYIYKIIATDFNGRQVEARGKAVKLR